ncbi:MAG: plasmid pRiA4b ORF-3 family protein [Deltaproteobacteria bacterium]|jgi:hypothetical protein|nr:plasmid pRiA4b ORF-3 family protein [Deltaproteobacteria bacterium]
MPEKQIFQFQVELKQFKPKIWRLFEINADASLSLFIQVVMSLFRMYGGHLIELIFHSKKHGLKQVEFNVDILGESDKPPKNSLIKLNRLFAAIGDKFQVTYDYGDDWQLAGSLKKIYADPNLKKDELPRILKGFGYGIVEDCGGVWGLEEIVKGSRGEKCDLDPEILEEYLEDDFNIENFDLDEENKRLKDSLGDSFFSLSDVEEGW